MKRNNYYVVFYFILGGFLTITTLTFGAGLFGLLMAGIVLVIGIWYWVRDPHEPKCHKCGMICRENAKSCPRCNGKIKKDHTGLIVGTILGAFFSFIIIVGVWVVHITCTEYAHTAIHQWFNC